MPNLIKDEAALGVNRVSDELPACDLFIGPNARRAGIADGGRRNIGGFRNLQAALGGALAVVNGIHLLRDSAGLARAQARQWGHDHTVGEGEGANLERLEKGFIGHEGQILSVNFCNAACRGSGPNFKQQRCH